MLCRRHPRTRPQIRRRAGPGRRLSGESCCGSLPKFQRETAEDTEAVSGAEQAQVIGLTGHGIRRCGGVLPRVEYRANAGGIVLVRQVSNVEVGLPATVRLVVTKVESIQGVRLYHERVGVVDEC